jgi:hypothetical protein
MFACPRLLRGQAFRSRSSFGLLRYPPLQRRPGSLGRLCIALHVAYHPISIAFIRFLDRPSDRFWEDGLPPVLFRPNLHDSRTAKASRQFGTPLHSTARRTPFNFTTYPSAAFTRPGVPSVVCPYVPIGRLCAPPGSLGGAHLHVTWRLCFFLPLRSDRSIVVRSPAVWGAYHTRLMSKLLLLLSNK